MFTQNKEALISIILHSYLSPKCERAGVVIKIKFEVEFQTTNIFCKPLPSYGNKTAHVILKPEFNELPTSSFCGKSFVLFLKKNSYYNKDQENTSINRIFHKLQIIVNITLDIYLPGRTLAISAHLFPYSR